MTDQLNGGLAMNKKTKEIKARKMWAFAHLACYAQRLAALCYCRKTTPVFVLPADAASVEAMVEQMAAAIDPSVYDACSIKAARAALAAIGIKSSK